MEAHLWATQPLRGQFSFQANMAALLLWALQNLLLARARARAGASCTGPIGCHATSPTTGTSRSGQRPDFATCVNNLR